MWIARATSSLPVPVSPRSSTVDVVGATCSTFASTSRSAGALADDVAEVELAVQLLVQVAGVLGELRREPPVLAQQVEALDRVLQDAAHLLRVPRLGDVAVDLAEVDRLDQHVDVGERGEDDADRVGRDARATSRSSSRPVIFGMRWSVTIDRDVLLREDRQRLGAAGRGQDVERLPEVEPEGVEVVLLVVDDEDRIALHVERHARAQRVTCATPAACADSAFVANVARVSAT